jgi:nicotinate-nucleotide adenylyltransferase
LHRGHIAIVETAIEELDIDRLIVMPAYLNPFKETAHLPASERLEKARRGFAGYKSVEVSSFEIDRGEATPTIISVEYLLQRYAPSHLYLIIGADNLGSLQAWKDYERLESLVEFVVARRDKITIPSGYKILDVAEDISSTKIREGRLR